MMSEIASFSLSFGLTGLVDSACPRVPRIRFSKHLAQLSKGCRQNRYRPASQTCFSVGGGENKMRDKM